MRATLAITVIIAIGFGFFIVAFQTESQDCTTAGFKMKKFMNSTSCLNTTLPTPNNTAFCNECGSSLVAYYKACPNVTAGPGVNNVTKCKFIWLNTSTRIVPPAIDISD